MRRIYPVVLLLFAWATFVASLPLAMARGFGSENIPALGLLVSPILLPANAAFLLGPLLLALSRLPRWRWVARLVSAAMLEIWVPLLLAVRDRSAADFMFGYYLFAGAYTIAFIAIQLPVPPPLRAAPSGGFPVIMDGSRPES